MAVFPFRPTLACACTGALLLAAACPGAGAADLITGGLDREDGFAAAAFRKMGRQWTPPPGLHGHFGATVAVSVDGRGRVTGCEVLKGSGMEAFDIAACAAARAAKELGRPPGGRPATLYCTFQRDTGEGVGARDPDEALRDRVRRAQRRATERRALDAGIDHEDARIRAERAAEEHARTFGSYEFLPGQDIPDAKQVMSRPVRAPQLENRPAVQQGAPAQLPERYTGGGAPAATGSAATPGPVIGRYPPRQETAGELVVTPPAAEGAPAPAGKAGQATAAAPAKAAAPVPAAQGKVPAKAADKPAQGKTPAASSPDGEGKQAGGGWVMPQPPVPPEGVVGQVVLP